MSCYRWLASLASLALAGAAPSPASCPADGKWDRAGDFGWTCRYRADDARLIAAIEKVSVVFMGDSITEGWAMADPAFFADARVDRGITSQTTEQMLLRFRQDVIALKPAVVHVMAGTNDIAADASEGSVATIVANIRRMADIARAARIRVVIGSVLPARVFGGGNKVRPATAIAALNRRLRDYAAAHRIAYADYYTPMAASDGGMSPGLSRDGVHPNKAGYAVMRPIADAAIAKALAR